VRRGGPGRPAIRSDQTGGIAVQILGLSLFLLLLTAGLGLLESARAMATKSLARRSLQAALASAVQSANPNETFHQILALNLIDRSFEAKLERRDRGESDPQTGAPLPHPLLVGDLRLPYRITWLGRRLPAVMMHVQAMIWQEG
jgi:hypothetical protein